MTLSLLAQALYRRHKASDAAERRAARTEYKDAIRGIEEAAQVELEAYLNELVERTSAQDGKTKIMIQRRDVGTVCDPGMEVYWTM